MSSDSPENIQVISTSVVLEPTDTSALSIATVLLLENISRASKTVDLPASLRPI